MNKSIEFFQEGDWYCAVRPYPRMGTGQWATWASTLPLTKKDFLLETDEHKDTLLSFGCGKQKALANLKKKISKRYKKSLEAIEYDPAQ